MCDAVGIGVRIENCRNRDPQLPGAIPNRGTRSRRAQSRACPNAPVRGALVSSVVPGSPAAAAGIRPGDLITQLDTEPIVAPAVFVSALSGLQPGDRVDIQVQRGSSQFTAHVKLASRPARSP